MSFSRVDSNWDNLVWGLDEKKYEGILSSMQPYLFTEKKYDYSDLYLKTGPALVVSVQSQDTSLDTMKGKEIGVIQGSSSLLIAEQNPDLLIRVYSSIPDALNDIVAGVIDGALIPVLQAAAYCRNLYVNQLKVASEPLNEEGLRLITLHQEDNVLISSFNKALKKLQEDSQYTSLREKWDLHAN